jgi:hypothetical protein
MNIIFVDYPDGAGGEYLSHMISLHSDFYKSEYTTADTHRHNYGNSIINQLNSTRYQNYSNWESIAESTFNKLKKDLELLDCDNICIPYHVCYHNHYKLLKNIFPKCTIIRIKPADNQSWHCVNLEILRKVFLVKFSLHDIKHTMQFNQKKKIKLNDFLGLDVILLRRDLDITSGNRSSIVKEVLLAKIETWDLCDYEIIWDNFYGNISNIPKEYLRLCNFLNITPNNQILNEVVTRNQKNLEQLTTFNYIEECKKFGIDIK